MIIDWNRDCFIVPQEELQGALQQALARFEGEYAELPAEYRLMLKPLTRTLLYKMEDRVRRSGNRERALRFRPGRKEDSVLFLAQILRELLGEVLNHAVIIVESADHTVTDFRLEFEDSREARGQMVAHGDLRLWEDYGSEIP